jgi:3-hydroxybutyryl-CoA dehydratase
MAEQASYCISELDVGMTASFTKTVTEKDVAAFAEVSGDDNPVHLDDEYAAGTIFKGRIAHGMLTGSFISTVIGTRLPGNGTIYMSQSLRFRAPVMLGDTVEATVEVTKIDRERRRVTLACACMVEGKPVLDGEAEVMVPAKR